MDDEISQGTECSGRAVLDSATQRLASERTQLLVSVRSQQEAELAATAGVDWIDVKEPAAGSLGAPNLEVARQVAGGLVRQSSSVALGEFSELMAADGQRRMEMLDRVQSLVGLYPYAKFGLSNLAPGWEREFSKLAGSLVEAASGVSQLGTEQAACVQRIVPVLYADFTTCMGATPEQVLEQADRIAARFVLVDTFVKDGRSLLDFQPTEFLADFMSEARRRGLRIVLAGSLKPHHFAALLPLEPFAIGVRGAACRADRDGELSPEKLKQLVGMAQSW